MIGFVWVLEFFQSFSSKVGLRITQSVKGSDAVKAAVPLSLRQTCAKYLIRAMVFFRCDFVWFLGDELGKRFFVNDGDIE